MARLDRLAAAREVAQLAATIGREFSYELIKAVSPGGEEKLPQALRKLLEAEVLYQRGVGNQTRYFVDDRPLVMASDIEPHYLRELTGRFADEATLFRLAAQLEHARPWANRKLPDAG